MLRLSALTTPTVTVCPSPNGLPIATASWPTRNVPDVPSWAAGSRSAVPIFTTAMSENRSAPTKRAGYDLPDNRVTLICCAPSTTWLLVRT